jgi:hypothetical protein
VIIEKPPIKPTRSDLLPHDLHEKEEDSDQYPLQYADQDNRDKQRKIKGTHAKSRKKRSHGTNQRLSQLNKAVVQSREESETVRGIRVHNPTQKRANDQHSDEKICEKIDSGYQNPHKIILLQLPRIAVFASERKSFVFRVRGYVDILRQEYEDIVRDLLYVAVERVRGSAEKVEYLSRRIRLHLLQIDDYGFSGFQAVHQFGAFVEALWLDDDDLELAGNSL